MYFYHRLAPCFPCKHIIPHFMPCRYLTHVADYSGELTILEGVLQLKIRDSQEVFLPAPQTWWYLIKSWFYKTLLDLLYWVVQQLAVNTHMHKNSPKINIFLYLLPLKIFTTICLWQLFYTAIFASSPHLHPHPNKKNLVLKGSRFENDVKEDVCTLSAFLVSWYP